MSVLAHNAIASVVAFYGDAMERQRIEAQQMSVALQAALKPREPGLPSDLRDRRILTAARNYVHAIRAVSDDTIPEYAQAELSALIQAVVSE